MKFYLPDVEEKKTLGEERVNPDSGSWWGTRGEKQRGAGRNRRADLDKV